LSVKNSICTWMQRQRKAMAQVSLKDREWQWSHTHSCEHVGFPFYHPLFGRGQFLTLPVSQSWARWDTSQRWLLIV
jgi:hypothetical protein